MAIKGDRNHTSDESVRSPNIGCNVTIGLRDGSAVHYPFAIRDGTFPRSVVVLGLHRPLALRIVLMQKVEGSVRKPSGFGICTAKMCCADCQM